MMCEQCLRICNAIGELNQDEGNSVTIFAGNAGFEGDDYAIEVCGEWTNWKEVRYGGRTIPNCLEEAVKVKRGPNT